MSPFQQPLDVFIIARPLSISEIAILLASVAFLHILLNSYFRHSDQNRGTPLLGPPSHSVLFGCRRFLASFADPGDVLEDWAQEYGSVYRVPDVLGTNRVMITDPKAIAHFYSKETFGYVHTKVFKILLNYVFGPGITSSEGEAHKRHRKVLAPAFSNRAIRNVTPIFYDTAYKLKTHWDNILECSSTGNAVIEVQHWMNRISLDSIGLAGFSHAFNSLSPSTAPASTSVIQDTFASFSDPPSALHIFTFLLASVFPFLVSLPTSRNKQVWQLNRILEEIGNELLEKMRGEVEGEDKSIIGLLLSAENAKSQLALTKEEVVAQLNSFLVAGYETTSISLTWAIIELCKNPSAQQILRDELLSLFPSSDPTYDQLANVTGPAALPYLDAVVHEVLRLHPPVIETARVAAEDDILPLLEPLVTASGTVVTSVHIPKGTLVTAPISCVNRSTAIWGEDAKLFKPERWLDGGKDVADGRWKEVHGHRHLLTFVDGPRMCLGKGFALAEFKAVLSVLIRNYTFEFPSGVDTEVENVNVVLNRPKIKGESGIGVSLRVGRVDV